MGAGLREGALEIVRRLQAGGHETVFAGGCVRDALLGKEPKDYDIATSARPEEVLALFPKGNRIGAHFGVILVRLGGHPYEIATFRTDGSYRDGRRPESVAFATAEEDAARRDFTVNGIFHDPVADRLIDHVGGREDLERRLLRAIGDPAARFGEDRLRLLRAIRFATALDFEIEAASFDAIREHAPRIVEVSPERIREELDRIWRHPARLRGFDLLDASGLLRVVLPEIEALKGCDQPPEWHPEGDVFTHVRLMLSQLDPDASLPLVLSVLLHDIAKPATRSVDADTGRIRFNGHDKLGAEMAGEILRRLRYSNEVIDQVVEAVSVHMAFANVRKMRTSKLRRFLAREHFAEELELHRVDCLSSNRRLENHDFLVQARDELAAADTPPVPERLVTGRDLIERGFPTGPAMGALLTRIQDLQLEGALNTREEALAWLENEGAG